MEVFIIGIFVFICVGAIIRNFFSLLGAIVILMAIYIAVASSHEQVNWGKPSRSIADPICLITKFDTMNVEWKCQVVKDRAQLDRQKVDQ